MRGKRVSHAVGCLTACILLLCCASSRADSRVMVGPPPPPPSNVKDAPTGFRGVVKDVSGDPIAEALVGYVGEHIDGARSVITDAGGAFEVLGLLPGPYVVSARADGYSEGQPVAVRVGPRAVSPVALRIRRKPSFNSLLVRFGVAHAWVAAMLTMGLLLWVHHRRARATLSPLPGGATAVVVGVLGGTALGVSTGFVANTFVHNIGLEPLSPAPSQPDLWVARNTATLLIAHVAMFTGAILGVGAGLAARRGCSVAQCTLATAIGGVAAGVAVAISESPSSAGDMLRLLAMLDEITSGQMWALYVGIGLVGSTLVGAVVGLCVGSAVIALARIRPSPAAANSRRP